ncbi:MAG: hypothetical protein IJL89_05755 [Firmicutes bacterium]|nr:hypothetical protein [Bacillota bacterium]
MKKLIFIAAATILTTLFSVCVYAEITPQEPTKTGGYYNIATPGNLYWFARYCGENSTDYVYARLTNDIALNGGEVTANSVNVDEWESIMDFNGKFNGYGHTISGLYVKGKEYAGLFGSTGSSASLDNIVIDKSYIEGTKYVGAVVGYNKSEFLYRCVNKGTVVSYSDGASTGGIVGYHYSNSNFAICVNYGDVIGTDYTGGIIGTCEYSQQPLREFENYGNVTGVKYAGGIVGNIPSSSRQTIVSKCLNHGNISAVEKAGGIVGFSDCYESGGSNGTVGWYMRSYNTIKSCYSSGKLSAETTYGITGHSNGMVEAINCCYLEGTATDKSESAVYGIPIGGKKEEYPIGIELSAADFASGRAAYILNGSSTPLNCAWRQDIGTDDYPYLNDTNRGLVYRNISTGEYSNTEDELSKTCRTLGDTDANRSLDIRDVIQILNKSASDEYFMPIETSTSSTQAEGVYGDINGDNSVTDEDAALLLKIITTEKVDMKVGTYVYEA